MYANKNLSFYSMFYLNLFKLEKRKNKAKFPLPQSNTASSQIFTSRLLTLWSDRDTAGCHNSQKHSASL